MNKQWFGLSKYQRKTLDGIAKCMNLNGTRELEMRIVDREPDYRNNVYKDIQYRYNDSEFKTLWGYLEIEKSIENMESCKQYLNQELPKYELRG